MQRYRRYPAFTRSPSDRVVTSGSVVHIRTDALRLGKENLYIDAVAPFTGQARLQELEKVIRDRLVAKELEQGVS
ncbi:MAG: hypothetical protein AB1700_15340 [Bacillota bacterium]